MASRCDRRAGGCSCGVGPQGVAFSCPMPGPQPWLMPADVIINQRTTQLAIIVPLYLAGHYRRHCRTLLPYEAEERIPAWHAVPNPDSQPMTCHRPYSVTTAMRDEFRRPAASRWPGLWRCSRNLPMDMAYRTEPSQPRWEDSRTCGHERRAELDDMLQYHLGRQPYAMWRTPCRGYMNHADVAMTWFS